MVHVREHAKKGKHRTEVTEATEGDWGLVDECTWVKIVDHVREHAKAESIAQRSRRPQR